MLWATRKGLKIDRVGCVWLIRNFIDPLATISFVDDSQIESLTRSGVLTFDAADARYRHDDDPTLGKYGEKCTFQILMDEYKLTGTERALDLMARIIYAGDIGHRKNEYEPKEGFGLWALTNGFSITTPDDEEKLLKELPMYDALFAYCKSQTKAGF